MQVSRTPELAEALLATGFPSRKRHASPNIHFYQEFTLRSHGVRRAGSAALDLAYVACGPAGRLLGVQPESLGHGGRNSAGGGGRRAGDGLLRRHFRLDSREILASNGLIHEELVGLFSDMFAGRDLTPIPTPQEFAAATGGASGNRMTAQRLRELIPGSGIGR